MTDLEWVSRWLDDVAAKKTSMSQRQLSTVERRGGLAVARQLARARGVHLLVLTDDKGVKLVAASTHPFEVVC